MAESPKEKRCFNCGRSNSDRVGHWGEKMVDVKCRFCGDGRGRVEYSEHPWYNLPPFRAF